jgi:hypothetical protein
MTSKSETSQEPVPKKRGRKEIVKSEKLEQANICLPAGLNRALQKLMPLAAKRNQLFARWTLALIASSESDRLFAQSSVAVKVLDYLENADGPIELKEEVRSLIEQSNAERVTKKSDSD